MVKNGDYRAALEFGEGIEDRFAPDPDFLFIIGSIYYILENGDNALRYFERALTINDSDAESLTLKAALYYARDEAPEAGASMGEMDLGMPARGNVNIGPIVSGAYEA